MRFNLKSGFAVLLPALILVFLFWQFRIADNQWKDVVASDGKGYYHYFIEYFIPEAERDRTAEKAYLQEISGQYYTKYPFGVSLLLSPFFGMGLATAHILGYPPDGLSFPFQLWAGFGALFYLLLGALFLYQLLRTYKLNSREAYFSTLFIVFGTNLLYYAVSASTMSHVYSFCAIAAFSFFVRRSLQFDGGRYWFAALLAFGVVIVLRPFNGIVLLAVPILLGKQTSIKTLLATFNLRYVSAGIVGCLLLVLVQLWLWHDQTGEWLLFSYSNEGFYFHEPRIRAVLFDWNRGLFVYTPLLLLSLLGAIIWTREDKKAGIAFILFFAIITYLISSWWCWNYASGFGLRPFIDFYAIFAIPLALLYNRTVGLFRVLIISLALLFSALNLIQSYQYANHILHHSSMDFEKYTHVFLKTGEQYEGSLGGNSDLPPYAPRGLRPIDSLIVADSGSTLIDTPFACTWTFEPRELPNENYNLFWTIDFEKKELINNSSTGALLVFDFFKGDQKSYYYTFPINDTPSVSVDIWQKYRHTVTTPCPKETDTVKVYLWNVQNGNFELRQFKVKVFRPCLNEPCN